MAESRQLTVEENKNRNLVFPKLLDLERISMRDLKQKARVKWSIDGDENSKFFHGVINNRNRKNRINRLMVNKRWIEDAKELKRSYFQIL